MSDKQAIRLWDWPSIVEAAAVDRFTNGGDGMASLGIMGKPCPSWASALAMVADEHGGMVEVFDGEFMFVLIV
jgi:hypothetical protein